MARPSRAQSTRGASDRTGRQANDGLILTIPNHLIPKGVVYTWVREHLVGQPDDNNVEKRLRGGWSPVPADAHPELVAPLLPGRTRDDHGVIRRGGLILCQMAKAEYDEIQKSKSQENTEAMKSTQWTRGELQDDDRRMPMVELADDPGMNQTSVERVVALPDK